MNDFKILFLLTIGSFSLNVSAQEVVNKEIEKFRPKFAINTSPLSFLAANQSTHLSFEFQVARKMQLALDVNYFFEYLKEKKEGEPNYLNTTITDGYGFQLAYKFLTNPNKRFQIYIGPAFGYRYLPYQHSQVVCTAIAESASFGSCFCTDVLEHNFSSTSKGIYGGITGGVQLSLNRENNRFFWGFQHVLGAVKYTAMFEAPMYSVTCSHLEEEVQAIEGTYGNDFENLLGNQSIQFKKATTLLPFLLLQLKFGYVF